MMLNEKELENVVGGKMAKTSDTVDFSSKRTEFDNAWQFLEMEKKGYTGNMRVQMFEEWESTGFKSDAVKFISEGK